MDDNLPGLGNLECEVMTLVGAEAPIAAEAPPAASPRLPDDSKITALLRLLKQKGCVAHVIEGRTCLCWPKQPRGRTVAYCRELQLLGEAIRQAKSRRN